MPVLQLPSWRPSSVGAQADLQPAWPDEDPPCEARARAPSVPAWRAWLNRMLPTVAGSLRAGHVAAPSSALSSAADLGVAFDCAGTAIVVTDAELRIVAANAAYARLSGYTAQELIGTRLDIGRPCGAATACTRLTTQPTGCSCARGRMDRRRRDGRVWTAWMDLRVVTDVSGRLRCHVATFTDITALEHERTALRWWAQYDTLTELPNRRFFDDELARCIGRARRHGRRFALLFLDLDRFKWVNDTHGHAAGDALLQQTARRLRAVVRAADTVTRWGGDEFIVVLEDLPQAAEAGRLAAALQAAIGQAMDVAGHRLHITASIGVAVFPEHGDTAADLIRAADAAMYQAKRRGPGQCAFYAAQ